MKKQTKLFKAIKLIQETPSITGGELAKALGVSKVYAYNLKSQAKRFVQGTGATEEQKAITIKDLLLSAKKRIKELETLQHHAEVHQTQLLTEIAKLKEGYKQSERELFETQAKNFDLKAIIKYLENRNAQ